MSLLRSAVEYVPTGKGGKKKLKKEQGRLVTNMLPRWPKKIIRYGTRNGVNIRGEGRLRDGKERRLARPSQPSQPYVLPPTAPVQDPPAPVPAPVQDPPVPAPAPAAAPTPAAAQDPPAFAAGGHLLLSHLTKGRTPDEGIILPGDEDDEETESEQEDDDEYMVDPQPPQPGWYFVNPNINREERYDTEEDAKQAWRVWLSELRKQKKTPRYEAYVTYYNGAGPGSDDHGEQRQPTMDIVYQGAGHYTNRNFIPKQSLGSVPEIPESGLFGHFVVGENGSVEQFESKALALTRVRIDPDFYTYQTEIYPQNHGGGGAGQKKKRSTVKRRRKRTNKR